MSRSTVQITANISQNPLALIAAQQQAAAAAAAAAADPVSYIPASARDDIRTYNVLKIYAVCHPKSADSGNGKTNHWTLSFDVGNGQGVGLDVQPNPLQAHSNGGMKAQVIVSKLNCVVTNTAERYDAVSVASSRPVSWYIEYLASGGRFRYAFTSEGIGCRHWIRDTLKLLADIGEVSSSDSESARRSLGRLWPEDCNAETAVGTYF